MAAVDYQRIRRGTWSAIPLYVDDRGPNVVSTPVSFSQVTQAVSSAESTLTRIVAEDESPMTPAQQEFAATTTTLAFLSRSDTPSVPEVRRILREIWEFIDGRWRP